MRARLQMLIDYTGISIKEAAALCGCSHEALSRKLAGKERYEVREDELARMQSLADAQDKAVGAMEAQIASILQGENEGEKPEIDLLAYRRDEDMLADNGFPFASAHRRVLSRLQQAHKSLIRVVIFDARKYDAWRGDNPDSSELRADWAAQLPKLGYGFKFGAEAHERGNTEQIIGWSVFKLNDVPQKKISSGKVGLK